MKKSRKLRELFERGELIKLVGAHNGLTAKLVEKNGFDGVWASSLEVSASHAVPDANILTMSDYLNAAIPMNDAVSIPVIVDVDQGYGNSTNVIQMVKKFEAAGIAGIIMEDKKFPKQNSLLADGRQELASIPEFVGKIMAAKNAQESEEFMVFARVEALIAGHGQEEAMKRAKAYVKAGVDGIMIHSKKDSPDEIIEFVKNWKERVPLVVVPTTYYDFTEEEIKKYPQIKMVIYANHGIRTIVKHVDETFKEIAEQKGVHTVHDKIASVHDVFKLQGTFEMKEYEKQFLKDDIKKIAAIIPAAGAPNESSLKHLLNETQLCMLDINGKPLLKRNVDILNSIGINNINVITGYNSGKINVEGINKIENKHYDFGILQSIMCAEGCMNDNTLIIYSDILFEKNIVERLIKSDKDIMLVVDSSYHELKDKSRSFELVRAKNPPISADRSIRINEDNEVLAIKDNLTEGVTHEFIGMALFSKEGIDIFKKTYYELLEAGEVKNASFAYIIQKIINKGITVNCLEIHKGWIEVHSFEDYKNAIGLIK